MRHYVRKITLSKWPKQSDVQALDIHQLRADAIADVRTFNDSLSIWSVASDSESNINEAVLALATASGQSSFDKMDVAIFSADDLSQRGLLLENADGDTAVMELRKTHQNIVGLTYDSLTIVMNLISEITFNSRQVRRSGKAIENLIKTNYNRIDLSVFTDDSMKEKIKKIAGKM
jgi:hypothetical protein